LEFGRLSWGSPVILNSMESLRFDFVTFCVHLTKRYIRAGVIAGCMLGAMVVALALGYELWQASQNPEAFYSSYFQPHQYPMLLVLGSIFGAFYGGMVGGFIGLFNGLVLSSLLWFLPRQQCSVALRLGNSALTSGGMLLLIPLFMGGSFGAWWLLVSGAATFVSMLETRRLTPIILKLMDQRAIIL